MLYTLMYQQGYSDTDNEDEKEDEWFCDSCSYKQNSCLKMDLHQYTALTSQA